MDEKSFKKLIISDIANFNKSENTHSPSDLNSIICVFYQFQHFFAKICNLLCGFKKLQIYAYLYMHNFECLK